MSGRLLARVWSTGQGRGGRGGIGEEDDEANQLINRVEVIAAPFSFLIISFYFFYLVVPPLSPPLLFSLLFLGLCAKILFCKLVKHSVKFGQRLLVRLLIFIISLWKNENF